MNYRTFTVLLQCNACGAGLSPPRYCSTWCSSLPTRICDQWQARPFYPQWIEFVESLPRGPGGKLLRYKLPPEN